MLKPGFNMLKLGFNTEFGTDPVTGTNHHGTASGSLPEGFEDHIVLSKNCTPLVCEWRRLLP